MKFCIINKIIQNLLFSTMSGVKFDGNKNQVHLIPGECIWEIGKVFTFGAKKYGIGNWQNGMSWQKIIAAARRHLLAIEMGEDFDPESKLYHVAHLAANAIMLLWYYMFYPQGDDRFHHNLDYGNVGIDIDDVLADFIPYYQNYFYPGESVVSPLCWSFDSNMQKNLESVKNNYDFWINMPVKTPPLEIPFEIKCYITSRKCNPEFTREWLEKNNFPGRPIFTTFEKSKVEIAREENLDIFIDDSFENFQQFNYYSSSTRPIVCYLFNSSHNTMHQVGYRRIEKLSDIPRTIRIGNFTV